MPERMMREHPPHMPDCFVPATYDFLWDGDSLVGEFRIQHPEGVPGQGRCHENSALSTKRRLRKRLFRGMLSQEKDVICMNTYVTGSTIRRLREDRNMTQAELAEGIGVSSKTISKWETGKGLPDISLLQPLTQALGISVIELMNGEQVRNQNISANLLRSKFYVCPICGNAIHALGGALVSCCGITLPPLEAEEGDEYHVLAVEDVEDEHFITLHHPMTKTHYISFLAYVTTDQLQLVKLYPEGNAQTRMQLRGSGYLYCCCNRHGLFRKKISCSRNA